MLAERIADKIETDLQAELDWLREYEAAIPLMVDDGDEELEDEELWTAADQWREQISNR